MAARRRDGWGADFVKFDNSEKLYETNGDLHKSSNGLNGFSKNGCEHNNSGDKAKNGKRKHDMPCIDWTKYDTSKESFEECNFITAFMTHLGFYILMLLGFINKLFFIPNVATEKNREGYAPLYNSFDQFYSRYVYRRVRDCWNRPICSAPGAEVTLKDRVTEDYGWTFKFTGTTTRCINLSSYNYLGFAQGDGICADRSIESIHKYGLTLSSPRSELGTCELHHELEKTTAQFLGVESSIVFGMGFGTNALNLPALIGPGALVLSDEKNHASLILGLRLSRVTVRVFKHNRMQHLEQLVREAIAKGQPDGQPWTKIVIVVEGVYSMEGSVVHLPGLLAIKRRYGCYVYLDEAHSVGAMGPRGRGITDYFGVDPKEIDVLMGTFTKSFGSAGGYIAGSKKLVDYIRAYGHAHTYAHSMAPPVAQQVLTSMRIIMGLEGGAEGARRVEALARNTRYFRRRLHQMGVIAHGHADSPVVPMLVYMFSKIGATVRGLTKRGVAVVGVGFPATPLMEGRIRFCLSAAHTKEQLDRCLNELEDAVRNLGLRHSRRPRDTTPIDY